MPIIVIRFIYQIGSHLNLERADNFTCHLENTNLPQNLLF